MYKTAREQHKEATKTEIMARLEECEICMDRYQNSNPEKYKEKEQEVKTLMQQLNELDADDNMVAAQKWCDITNALIRKYKTLAENHPSYAIERLDQLEELLIKEGFLTEKDIKDVL